MKQNNALKDPAHRANVIKMLACFVLMLICLGLSAHAMDAHWEIRVQLGFACPGILYLLTIFAFIGKDGFSDTGKQ